MREPLKFTQAVPTAEDMRRVGERLGAAAHAMELSQPLIITLDGELGAGKTTLVAGILAGFGHTQPVRSPTYTLIEPIAVQGRMIYHLDLYRLSGTGDLEDVGFRDLLTPGNVVLVEWGVRAPEALSRRSLAIEIRYPEVGRGESAGGRIIDVMAADDAGHRLVMTAGFEVAESLKAIP